MSAAPFFFSPPPPTRKNVSVTGLRNRDSDLSVSPSLFIVWVLWVCWDWFQTIKGRKKGFKMFFFLSQDSEENKDDYLSRTLRVTFSNVGYHCLKICCCNSSLANKRLWSDLLLGITKSGPRQKFKQASWHLRCVPPTVFQCSRTVKQLHYVKWPDHGVPDSIPPILQMLVEMRSSQSHDDNPICIHCRWVNA